MFREPTSQKRDVGSRSVRGVSLSGAAAAVHQVLHTDLVAAAEAFAVVVTQGAFDVRVAVLVAVVHVRTAVVVEVLARTLDAVVEAAPGSVLELGRRSVPSALIRTRRRWRRSLLVLRTGSGGGEGESGGKSECGEQMTCLQGEPAFFPADGQPCS